jgi:hypothetical protein
MPAVMAPRLHGLPRAYTSHFDQVDKAEAAAGKRINSSKRQALFDQSDQEAWY